MKTLLSCVTILLLLAGLVIAAPHTDVAKLRELEERFNARWERWRGPEFERARQATTGLYGRINADPDRELMGIDDDGNPVVYVLDNLNAAISTRTDLIQPGGETGYELDGSSTDGLYHWDNCAANPSHQEFSGRVVTIDGAGTWENHGNHTAGTMMAAGVVASAKGMASDAIIHSYDWFNDDAEMAAAGAAGAKISSHSYHTGNTYGAYIGHAREYDEITYAAPYYTICLSAGNAGNAYGWDSISSSNCSKNPIVVGAVEDVPNYDGPGSVDIAYFSSLGPTDDGRIKPDIVGNGVDLYSCTPTSYMTESGTSMSTPNVAGSAFLLYELYEQTHDGEVALSSTIKAVVIHTADECGDWDGPDYRFGWGLMNARRAADMIAADEVENPESISEEILTDGGMNELTVESNGVDPLRVTICWTDPPAQVNANPALVNDLDLRMIEDATGDEFMPYVLDGNNPTAPVERDDNTADNVEQVYISDPAPGTYTIVVSHKNSLQDGEQAYSLVFSGATGGEAPAATLYLNPIWNYIPPQGGLMRYGLVFNFNRDMTVPGVDYWVDLVLPNGNDYGPIYDVTFTATPYMHVEMEMQQNIPGFAPSGVYTVTGKVGIMPGLVVASDSFEMTKFEPWSPDGSVDDWSGSGLEFLAGGASTAADDIGATEAVPDRYELGDVYPNPFNASATVTVRLPDASQLIVEVYDVTGRLVRTLADGRFEAGAHALAFDGTELASGVYFVRAIVPRELSEIRKLTLLR
ncbi:MAG: Serine protease AprX [Calditrichaeota bacterium]|nr:Serine protease AprX [Calditrichota bacterium]